MGMTQEIGSSRDFDYEAGFSNGPAFFLVNLVPLCYHRPMRRPYRKTFLPLFVLLFLSIPLPSQTADSQTVWVKRVIGRKGGEEKGEK